MDISKLINEEQLQVTFSVRAPEEIDVLDLAEKIKDLGNLEEINLSD